MHRTPRVSSAVSVYDICQSLDTVLSAEEGIAIDKAFYYLS